MMREDIESVLISEEAIKQRISELALEINRDYKGREPVVISVLRGAFIFMADLVRHLDFQCKMDFMSISSYTGKNVTSGGVKIIKDLQFDIEGEDVLIVEDILDSGRSLSYLMELLSARKPNSIKICTLLDKPSRREFPVETSYVGFEIPDAFVVGYGLDFDDRYRNLPYIGVLKPELYGG